MSKTKISKKQELTLSTIPRVNISKEKLKSLSSLEPKTFFLSSSNVGEALLQSLIENDTDAFMEILGAYLRVNKKRAARNSKLTRTTVQSAFSKGSNPTLKTIAKIVHYEAKNIEANKKDKNLSK